MAAVWWSHPTSITMAAQTRIKPLLPTIANPVPVKPCPMRAQLVLRIVAQLTRLRMLPQT